MRNMSVKDVWYHKKLGPTCIMIVQLTDVLTRASQESLSHVLCARSTNEPAAGRRTSGTAAILVLRRGVSFTWAHFQLQSLQPCQLPILHLK